QGVVRREAARSAAALTATVSIAAALSPFASRSCLGCKPLRYVLSFLQCGINLWLQRLLLITAEFDVGFRKVSPDLIHRIDSIDASEDLRLVTRDAGRAIAATAFFLCVRGKCDKNCRDQCKNRSSHQKLKRIPTSICRGLRALFARPKNGD